jgi:aerobic carbon-monoxide dehydrogenase large subunit
MPRYVGTSVRRQEDPALLRGQARFIGDLKVPGLLTVAFLRSSHPHARLLEVDVREAAALPGVAAIMTGADVAATTRPIRARLDGAGYKETGWPPLAIGKTRFVGEPVAAVVATDRYQAEDALEAIRVTYEPLPAAVDREASMRPDAPRLHEEIADNVLLHARYQHGDVEQALVGAEIRFRESLRHARCSSPMEGRGVMAALDATDGVLSVWASTQTPHLMRTGLPPRTCKCDVSRRNT